MPSYVLERSLASRHVRVLFFIFLFLFTSRLKPLWIVLLLPVSVRQAVQWHSFCWTLVVQVVCEDLQWATFVLLAI